MIEIKELVRQFLINIGENPEREGLEDTPIRVENSLKEIFLGYYEKLENLEITTFNSENFDELVVLKDIDFFSTCEHHLLPFFGQVHIGYLPNGKIIGISKLARVVNHFSRRLQNQERLTQQITDFLEEKLNPRGIIVVIEGIHLCMKIRGVKQSNSTMITSKVSGVFRDKNCMIRNEFFSLINK